MKFLRSQNKNNKSQGGKAGQNVAKLPSGSGVVQTVESMSVYTDVLDTSDLSVTPSKPKQKSGGRFKLKTRNITKDASTSNLDKKILETERKIRSQLRQLASESFEDYDDDDESNFDDDSEEKRKMRLMTTSGVLLFDGLAEDIPDDRSLQSLIRKERREISCQYYNDSSASLFPGAQAETNFVSAPKNYDPIKAGFINPNERRSYYNSDEEETRDTAQYGRKQRGQDDDEPSVEVVINEQSSLWKL